MQFFGSSGIRGIVNRKITPELALRVGKAVGTDRDSVIIGRDTRPTGMMLSAALKSGITAVGADVTDIGVLPTPTLAFATREHDCGVMITASHNPAPYNGIKLWNPDGSAFNTEQMEETEAKIIDDTPLPEWNKVGTILQEHNAIDYHIEHILGMVGTDHSLKVAIDCANGPACRTTPYLLRRMGCQVVTLNCNPDGTFPAHDPEPTEENFKDLGKLVVKTGADMGIAHDGDADRMVAFDREGNYLGGDTLLALFARRFTDSIVVPVNTSMIIDELVNKVIRTKVGDVYVAEELKKHKAQFGGEPSGTWIFPEISYAPDAIYAAAFLTVICEDDDLAEINKTLPSYPSKRKAFPVDNNKSIMEVLISRYKEEFLSDELNFIDGIRIDHEDGWALTRASGTEPKIRITAEANDKKRLEMIFDEAKKMLEEAMR